MLLRKTFINISRCFQGHARGNRKALVVRSKLQTVFRKFGRFTQSHCAPVILVGFIPLILCAFGLTRATLETNAENLWIEGMLSTLDPNYLFCGSRQRALADMINKLDMW